jgi:hypothetical protein
MLSTEVTHKDIKANPAGPKVLIVENEGVVALDMCAMIEPLGQGYRIQIPAIKP